LRCVHALERKTAAAQPPQILELPQTILRVDEAQSKDCVGLVLSANMRNALTVADDFDFGTQAVDIFRELGSGVLCFHRRRHQARVDGEKSGITYGTQSFSFLGTRGIERELL